MSKNEKDIKVKLNGSIVNILKFFLPTELYINPFINSISKNRVENPKFKNHLSNEIYELEKSFYAITLKRKSVDLKKPVVYSITPSGKIGSIKKYESPKINSIVQQRDSLLIKLIREFAKKNNDYIFQKFEANLNYRQIYNKVGSLNAIVNKKLKEVSQRNQMPEFSFHTARHTFANLSRLAKTDIYLISKCLGHSSLSITEQYLRNFENQEVYDVNDGIHELIRSFYE